MSSDLSYEAAAGRSRAEGPVTAAAASAMLRRLLARRIEPRALLAAILLLLAVQNLLLWRFLNFAPSWLYLAAGVTVCGVSASLLRRRSEVWTGPQLGTVLFLAAVSISLLLLGGEGRIFYANADWQVRDAVLRDLIVYTWPFAYPQGGTIEILRAPIGMYLIPALAGKAYGPVAADLALLLQNSAMLTILLSLGSTLFQGARAKWIGLAVFILFSGMDIVGQLVRSGATGEAIPDHLERWGFLQYSSHVTQLFWVPMHALAGWFGALLFLLWRQRLITLGQAFVFVPLIMLLSPLGVMGTLPFAAYAGCATVLERRLTWNDFLLPFATLLLSVPAILYLGAAGSSVGLHALNVHPTLYALFLTVEVLPFLAGAIVFRRPDDHERGTLAVVAACLFVLPLFQLGEGMDFTMRVSIPALAALAVLVAQALSGPATRNSGPVARRLLALAVLAGSATGAFEIARAVAYKATPRVRCSMMTSIYQVVDLPKQSSTATYFAPLDALAPFLRPARTHLVDNSQDRQPCWDRPWQVKRTGGY